MYKRIIFLQIISNIFGFSCKKKKKSHFISLASKKRKELVYSSFLPPFGGVCVSSPLAQVDLSPKHGDEQNDGEAAEHPQVLKQEEDQLGGGVGLFLGYVVHLWELRRKKDLICLIGSALTLLFYILHNGRN